MRRFFVPYNGKRPAPIVINGHKLLIVSQDKTAVEEGLPIFGADCVKAVRSGPNVETREAALNRLAKSIDGGIVVAPSDIEMHEIVRSLETQLPWLQ